MAKYVTLELFKKHVRVDYDDDDDYLQMQLDAAEAWVIRATQRDDADLLSMGEGSFPLPLCQAAYLMGGHWYNQREAVSSSAANPVPYAVETLVKPFVKLVSDTAAESARAAADRAEEAADRAETAADRAEEAVKNIGKEFEEITAEEVNDIWNNE